MFESNEHPSQQPKTYVEYWNIIRRNKWAIISITVVATIIGVLIASSMKPVYLSSARLLVESDNRQLLNLSNNSQVNTQVSQISFYRTQLEIIRSRSLLKQVIEQNKLSRHMDYLPENKGLFETISETDEKGMPTKARVMLPQDIDKIISQFNNRLHVSLGSEGDTINLSYESGDPVMAAKVVNSLTQKYIKEVQISQQQNSQQNVQWLAKNLEEARKKLVDSEARLQAYQVEEKLNDSKEEDKIKSGKISGITSELLNARTNKAIAEARYNQIENLPKTIEAYSSLQYILNNSMVVEARQKEEDLSQVVADLSDRYGDKHPKMIKAKRDLALAKHNVRISIFAAAETIKSQYQLAVDKEKQINRIYEQMQKESLAKNASRFSLAKLERDVDTNKELYDMLLTRFKEADMTKDSDTITVKVLDAPQVPASPFKPNRKRIIMIAFLLGLAGSIFLSILREFSDKTFRTGEDVIEKTKLPLLGIFPTLSKKDLLDSSPERLIVEKPRSSVSESVNNIRTNILLGKDDESPQVIMVTSAVASEGKTTVSCNLGISLARLGPTLIIEADTRRPRMRNMHNRKKISGGVFEYIAGKASLKDSVILDDSVKNLYILPVAMKPAKPLEFLSSKRFKEALILLRKKFKFIVIDTPPVLPVSDALVLAPIVDGTLLVIGAESTKHAMTKDAISRIETVGAPILGCVLSRANPKTFGSYGSNYYYGYGYGYSAY